MTWLDRSEDSSVAGRSCHGCGFDEAATSFLAIEEPVALHGFTFCNRCGYVYGSEHRLDLEATKTFFTLGRPGFDGSGKLWDPDESFEGDDQLSQ